MAMPELGFLGFYLLQEEEDPASNGATREAFSVASR